MPIENVEKLCDLIEKKLGVKTNYWNNPYGWREGKIDDKRFNVFFVPDKYLVVTAESEEIMDKLMPIMLEAMNGIIPLWRYNEFSDITIEWDLDNPELRLEELQTRGGRFSNKITNFEILSDRVYGLDPGNIVDFEKVPNMSEVDLYLTISRLKKFIEDIKGNSKANKEYRYAIEYLIYQTRKFGLTFPEPKFWRHVPETQEYQAWYNFYDKHFHGTLTEKEFDTFIGIKQSGGDISSYMPAGNWRDALKSNQKSLGTDPRVKGYTKE